MTLLDRLKQAEAAATPGPWSGHQAWTVEWDSDSLASWEMVKRDRTFIILLRNHAADLIRLVEAADPDGELGMWSVWESPDANPHPADKKQRDLYAYQRARDQLRAARAPFLAEEDAR